MGKVKALFDKSVRFVCGWARRWNDLYWFVACLWLVSVVCGFGFNFENEIITCAGYLQVNVKMTVKRALGIIQVGSRMCAWLDTSKRQNGI